MPEIKTNRHFGLIMTGACLVLGVIIPFIKHKPVHVSLVITACLFLFFALVFPQLLERPRQWWLVLGEKLGAINTRILFTIIYLTLFTIVHFIFFLMKRDKMKRGWKKYSSTYQVKSEISSFQDPF
ncbi:MAG: SxtJ family membrane protein [Bacteriovorax sp.]